MRSRVVQSIVALLLLSAPQAAAQDRAPLGSVAALAPVAAQRVGRAHQTALVDSDTTSRGATNDGSRSDTTRRLHTKYSAGERFAMRSVMGAVGWFGGAYVGAYAGGELAELNCRSHCPANVENAAWTGLFVGGILGSTLVVSAMGYGDRCNVGSRIALAALGATLGTGVGAFLGSGEYGGGYALFAIPIGGGLGGAFGAGLCTAEGPAHRKK